jgi:PelA/Pel-15E family pectate lyase
MISPLAAVLGGFAAGCEERREASAPRAPAAPAEPAGGGDARARALDAMKRAARFMSDVASHKGGYVWSYLPDFSRCWGELEARRSMLWVQPPGTPSVGHLFLDAFNATGDEQYLSAASQAAAALITAQHSSGGWNYVYDFAGPASLAEWYATVARNAWRMEEFHLHPDNATFDDACTAEATQFLLRLLVLRPSPELSAAVDKALRFVRQSQYPNGGWPQRFPLGSDYTSLVTFNDDVLGENIKTLVMAYNAVGDRGLGGGDLMTTLKAAMDCVVAMQQPLPQPGWGLQHDLEGKPARARSFEPEALATHTTAANIGLLITFRELTGDARYTERVPEALAWLERVALPSALASELGGTHPTFIEIGSNEALHVHRRGSNVWNGQYYVDKSVSPRLAHYSPARMLDVPALRRRLQDVIDGKGSGVRLPARPGSVQLPRYFSPTEPGVFDLCAGRMIPTPAVTAEQALQLAAELDGEGRWLSPLELVSNPYRAHGSREPFVGSAYASTNVGDRSDTSPYRPAERPETYPDEAPLIGISVRRFIQNMSTLIAFVSPVA